jgi:bifunctional DNA-binding transcriptional regulator/antitoxin component of YhaV-PrlF toxin-antitoxin module
MSMQEELTIEKGGKITLPSALRDRYGLTEDVPLRIIETGSGILLIPLTDEPMSAALIAELEEWQSLASEGFELFPYEDDAA